MVKRVVFFLVLLLITAGFYFGGEPLFRLVVGWQIRSLAQEHFGWKINYKELTFHSGIIVFDEVEAKSAAGSFRSEQLTINYALDLWERRLTLDLCCSRPQIFLTGGSLPAFSQERSDAVHWQLIADNGILYLDRLAPPLFFEAGFSGHGGTVEGELLFGVSPKFSPEKGLVATIQTGEEGLLFEAVARCIDAKAAASLASLALGGSGEVDWLVRGEVDGRWRYTELEGEASSLAADLAVRSLVVQVPWRTTPLTIESTTIALSQVAHRATLQARADTLRLDATLDAQKLLTGTLSVESEDKLVYPVRFGCTFVEHKLSKVAYPFWNLTHYFTPRPTHLLPQRPWERLLERQGLHLTRGWLAGEQVPVEFFVSPFIFGNAEGILSGVGNVKGRFNERELVLDYGASNVLLETPYMRVTVPQIEAAVHTFDLVRLVHFGQMEVREGVYIDKEERLTFADTTAHIAFHNKTIHLSPVSTQCLGVDLEGEVYVDCTPIDSTDVHIATEKLQGPLPGIAIAVAHYAQSAVTDDEVRQRIRAGRVNGELLFHGHFPLSGVPLLSCRFTGKAEQVALPLLDFPMQVEALAVGFDYSLEKNSIDLHDLRGHLHVGDQIYPLECSSARIEGFPDPWVSNEGRLLVGGEEEPKRLEVNWGKRPDGRCGLQAIQGELFGVNLDLQAVAPQTLGEGVSLTGQISMEPQDICKLLPTGWREKISHPEWLDGKFYLQGNLTFPASAWRDWQFQGHIWANEPSLFHCNVKSLGSRLTLSPSQLRLDDLAVSDDAGALVIDQISLQLDGKESGKIDLSVASLSGLQPNRLRRPGVYGEQPKSLVIKHAELRHLQGNLADLSTLQGEGFIAFSSETKMNLLKALMLIPTDLISRIGLNFALLVPVSGSIYYTLSEGRCHIVELRDVYSEGKRSQFYLPEAHADSYIDFDGNVSISMRMRHYNLLFKIAELFTLSVHGKVNHLSYSLERQP